MLKRFLFPLKAAKENYLSALLLALRIVFGVLLMTHGYQKLTNYDTLSQSFPDPLGIGSALSVTLALFGELVCSIGFITGFLYRLSVIPMIVTMLVAFFITHGGSISNGGELAFLYLVVITAAYLIGPGKYSVDYYWAKK